jgi:5-methylthioadenosine/S-adenosylhomocysteine deaminase
MKTLIEGGWVVAFNGTSHEVYENGSVVYENDRIVHAGGPYTGAVDRRLSARGKLVSPGFINTHVHTTGNGGDYMLHDMMKNNYRTANYLSFAAPLKGKMGAPPSEVVAALRTYVFLHALKHGSTTIIDVGGQQGDWEGYVRLIETLGVRVYTSPPFRDRNTFTDAQGRIYYDTDTAGGQQGLESAVNFIRTYDGAAQGRLRGMLNPAQVETCSEPLLRACKAAARDLNVPVHTHAGGNLLEFQRIMEEYCKTPVQFLADIGFLDTRTLLGHGVFTTAHPWSHYSFGDDLRVLVETGATVGHCPYKYAKMAITLHSFQRYLNAGVHVALGTDTFPMDMVAELRWASMLAKITDQNYQVGQPRDVYNAATLGACTFLGRDDLGRLAPGAKADILLINLDHLGSAFYADPIKALVDFGCGRDVDTVIVDGKTLVQGGDVVHVDEAEVYANAQQATHRFWSQIPTWHWGGCHLEEIVPPAFPMHRTAIDMS